MNCHISPNASPEDWTAYLLERFSEVFANTASLSMWSRHDSHDWLVGRHVLAVELCRSWLRRHWVDFHYPTGPLDIGGRLTVTPSGREALAALESAPND